MFFMGCSMLYLRIVDARKFFYNNSVAYLCTFMKIRLHSAYICMDSSRYFCIRLFTFLILFEVEMNEQRRKILLKFSKNYYRILKFCITFKIHSL